MIRLLIATTPADASAMNTLLAGLSVHSEADVEAFPMWENIDEIAPEAILSAFPELANLHDTWMVIIDDQATLETLCALVESVPWKKELSFINDGLTKKRNAAEFHKAIMVTGELRV